MLKPESIAFLRELGMPESSVENLAQGVPTSITGEVLVNYLREAWKVGRYSARDYYTWHSPAELLGEPGA